jgi:hypothetical protein
MPIVKAGGAKKKTVFEKINANGIFGCGITNPRFDIHSFWDYIDHTYADFFIKQNGQYDPNDTAIIFHHWFYHEHTPAYIESLYKTTEWNSKKASFSITYRKPYNAIGRTFWNAIEQGDK